MNDSNTMYNGPRPVEFKLWEMTVDFAYVRIRCVVGAVEDWEPGLRGLRRYREIAIDKKGGTLLLDARSPRYQKDGFRNLRSTPLGSQRVASIVSWCPHPEAAEKWGI